MTTVSADAQPKASVAVKRRRTARHKKTKKSILVEMLSRKSGADIAAISNKLGWQQHTARAALSRLRKAGYEVVAEDPRNGKPTKYRITASPAQ